MASSVSDQAAASPSTRPSCRCQPQGSRDPGRQSERGSATIELLGSLAVLLMLVVLFCQFAVFLYGRGVVRQGVVEAGRAGALLDAPAGACAERFDDVVSGLLGGGLRDSVGSVSCEVGEEFVVVVVEVNFTAWVPGWPDWAFQASGVTVREVAP